MFKALFLFALFGMLVSLFGSAFFLLKDQGNSENKRTYLLLRSRIFFGVLLFAIVAYALATHETSLIIK